MPQFKYRFVRFGTRFSAGDGARTDGRSAPEKLHPNELAVDVGGRCWGFEGETLAVLDHHFHRAAGQFPSAAAAVIHNAERIRERLPGRFDTVWLVTHQQPDFDAFSAMYLARRLIEGAFPADNWAAYDVRPDGWFQTREEIDWFAVRADALPRERRWAALLAGYAACVDHCRRLACPNDRSLHSILYAALLRGRDYLSETSGACEFFDEVRAALADPDLQLNPQFDSVLEGSRRFAPELSLLDRETAAYRRDVGRARKAVVCLQAATERFADWYKEVQEQPLVDGDGQPNPAHLVSATQRFVQADGIYLRDPECLLFKDWVRSDLENSSMGEGFLFSAVAYGGGRRDGAINATDYFFSLDPERAGARHLYNVWARLETAELNALRQPAHAQLVARLETADGEAGVGADGVRTSCRAGFLQRAGELRPLFDDPWFDGANYACTIIGTPNRGTLIDPGGVRDDLSDDPIVQIVERELEWSVFTDDLTVYDIPAAPHPPVESERVPLARLGMQGGAGLAPGRFRFGQIPLGEDIDLFRGQMAEQVGRMLWKALDPDNAGSVPTDFIERHLFRSGEWVGVWSRRGVAVAYKPRATQKVAEFRDVLSELIDLTADLQALVNREPTAENTEEIVAEGEDLTRRVAQIKHSLALPESRLLGRFFEASQLDEVLEMLRDVNQAAVEKIRAAQSARTLAQIRDLTHESAELQGKVEWLEVFFIAVYTAELIHIIGDSLNFAPLLVGYGSLGYSLIAGALAYYVLDPKEHVRLAAAEMVGADCSGGAAGIVFDRRSRH